MPDIGLCAVLDPYGALVAVGAAAVVYKTQSALQVCRKQVEPVHDVVVVGEDENIHVLVVFKRMRQGGYEPLVVSVVDAAFALKIPVVVIVLFQKRFGVGAREEFLGFRDFAVVVVAVRQGGRAVADVRADSRGLCRNSCKQCCGKNCFHFHPGFSSRRSLPG